MKNNDIIKKFCSERNLSFSTEKGYYSAIKKYEAFSGMSIEELIAEAYEDEENGIPLKKRRIKNRLLDYRTHLLKSGMAQNSIKTYFSKLKTFYNHHEVEMPILPQVKYDKSYEISYWDLPTKEHIRQALDIVGIDMKAIILFMSSSGTAKAETLSLAVADFINGTIEYHGGGSMNEILEKLEKRNDVVPTFYLRRLKTDKYYYTFCSPEASRYIVKYLKTRKNLKMEDRLFNITNSYLMSRFQDINDKMGWGLKGKYRFFRTHTLRKYHASNIGLGAEYIDSLQGRSKNVIHETYIKTNPKEIKEIYKKAMHNVMVYYERYNENVEIEEEYNIIINIFMGDKTCNLL